MMDRMNQCTITFIDYRENKTLTTDVAGIRGKLSFSMMNVKTTRQPTEKKYFN